jgi:hypothetical protein
VRCPQCSGSRFHVGPLVTRKERSVPHAVAPGHCRRRPSLPIAAQSAPQWVPSLSHFVGERRRRRGRRFFLLSPACGREKGPKQRRLALLGK